MQEEKEGERQTTVTAVLSEMFAHFDTFTAAVSKEKGVTCTKGCAFCCELLATISFPEGLLIAEHLFTTGTWREMLPKLRANALAADYEGITQAEYLRRRTRCAFLGSDNLCTIYEKRPAACRLHLVVNDPKICEGIEENIGKTTMAIELLDLEAMVWEFAKDVERQLNIRSHAGLMVAPIPIMVLTAMLFMTSGEKDEVEIFKAVSEATEGLSMADSWMFRHHASMASEGPSLEGAAQEKLIQIGRRLLG